MYNRLIATSSATGLTTGAWIFDSTGAVWNGSAFVTWSDGSVGTYVRSLTEIGTTGIYTAAVPGLAAGVYWAIMASRSGGSWAVTDIRSNKIFEGPVSWTGSAIASLPATQASAASANTSAAAAYDSAADLQLRVRQIIGGSTSDDATATTLLWFSDQTSNYAVGTIIGIAGYEARINAVTFDGEITTLTLNRSIPGISGTAASFAIFGCPPDNTYSADIAAIVKGTRAVLASSTTSYTPSVGETTVSLLADWTIYAGQTMKRRSDGSEYLIVSVSTANVDPGYSTITISPGLIGNSTSDDVYYALANDRRNESGVAPLNVTIEGNSVQVTDQ